jgi:hypothetical protein
MFNNFFSENFTIYEIKRKIVIESQTTIWLMRIACWITKATDTHPEYVLIFVFPLYKWLYERASILPYAYTACLVTFTLTQHRQITLSSLRKPTVI